MPEVPQLANRMAYILDHKGDGSTIDRVRSEVERRANRIWSTREAGKISARECEPRRKARIAAVASIAFNQRGYRAH